MKKIRKIAVEQNFAAISVGKLNELNEYELQLGPDVKIPGKVFCSTALGTTGSEFSFQSFAPGTETGFLHSHKSHEELYFFLSGKGEFQVDGTVFPVEEGSVVRVSPAGKRSVRTGIYGAKAAYHRHAQASRMADDRNERFLRLEA